MGDQQIKIKGVVDIVFLLDSTGSMAPCIDALKEHVSTFIDTLTTFGPNNDNPVKDWRAKVVGYRDFDVDGANWFIDSEFVRDVAALKGQLTALKAEGGGDEAESLLDALYKIAKMEQTDKGQPEDPRKWRYRYAAARVVVIFTDATYKPKMSIPEAKGGGFDDLANAVYPAGLRIILFAPDFPCYNEEFSSLDRSEYMRIPVGVEGPQAALKNYTSNQANFEKVMIALAKTVSQEPAPTPIL